MKKQLSLILCVSILLSLLSGFSLVAYADDSITIPYGTGTVTINGAGTQESPYLIETGEQFAAVFGTSNTANHSLLAAGKYYKQIADITLPSDYKPVATADGSLWNSFWFQGTYEGDKKFRKIDFGTRTDELKNFALFHSLGEKCVIRSIEVTGTFTNTNTSYSAGFANASYGGSITGCKSSIVVNTAKIAIGGFVVDLRGTVDTCIFDGSIVCAGYTGGIAAYNGGFYGTTTPGIYNNIVSGVIDGGTGVAGGLISYIRNASITYDATYNFNILNNMFIGTLKSSANRSGVICAGINAANSTANAKPKANVFIYSNLIVTPTFGGWTNDSGATYKMDRVFGYGPGPNYMENGKYMNIAYYPSGATLCNIQKETLVTDINDLTGPELPVELTKYADAWSYFPKGGNSDFKLPQLTTNPYTEEVPEWLSKLFATAETPEISIENRKNVATAIVTPKSEDNALGYRVSISDSLGHELGVVASGAEAIPLSEYITEEGTYKIKVMSLGGYKSYASEYGEEISFEYEITLPETLLTTDRVYISVENEIYSDDDGWYRNFAVIASEAYPAAGYTVSSYGVLLNTSDNVDLDNYSKKLDGRNISKNGQFGILIYGNGLNAETTYYARSYAVYEDEDGNETKVYGNVQSFSL